MRSLLASLLICSHSILSCSPEPSSNSGKSAESDAATKALPNLSLPENIPLPLRQRLDAVGLWPIIEHAKLLPLLKESTTFEAVGYPKEQLRGRNNLIAALKTFQSGSNPWRVSASRGIQTDSRVAIELELVRCDEPEDRVCQDRKAAFLFASTEGNGVAEVNLFVSERHQEKTRELGAQRPIRWLSGRPNPRLEKLFRTVWDGDLNALLADDFRFVDKASGREIRGKTDFIRLRDDHARFLSNGQCKATEIHSAGDVVIALSTCQGTLTRGIRGQGKQVSVSVADVARFTHAKMVELHTYSNHAEAMMQLGVADDATP